MATIQEVERPQATEAFQIPQSRFDGSTGPRIIGPRDGKTVDLGSVGVRFMVWGAETGGSFSLVEHPIPPRTLAAPLQTEGKSLQTAIDALAGKEPDAALQARIKAFQAKQQQGAQEIQRQQQQIQANQQYVQKQIAEKLGPIYTQVMQRRGANIMVEIGTTLASASGIDVTTDVLTALNTAMPSLQTTAPAPARPAQQPQGR